MIRAVGGDFVVAGSNREITKEISNVVSFALYSMSKQGETGMEDASTFGEVLKAGIEEIMEQANIKRLPQEDITRIREKVRKAIKEVLED